VVDASRQQEGKMLATLRLFVGASALIGGAAILVAFATRYLLFALYAMTGLAIQTRGVPALYALGGVFLSALGIWILKPVIFLSGTDGEQ
jgi:hypothetical protein